ncbi:carcinoembryonic antigen-related cell adhesion molecule 19-like isoform X2 [Rhineura floridana]|uniref:carcinoembryonic antigen-related cell adhesion molecule 19-like isoform X2 n=1 Tax=Rhineura floridana TaxID=261503 RepID=UPI002AC8696E|nr:carcinoembryonic antigen-related cell adhesion molecule 19-like isoform X2 [Rhineura floridana]
MMGLHSSRQGSLKALLLTGFILSCVLQLVPAQRRLSVMVEPSNPKVGQNITLTLWGSPSSFVQCQWSRETRSGGSGTIATYSPQSRDQQRQGSAYSGRETVYRNCSLHITRLTQLDTGNYTVEIEEAPVQQPDQEQDTEGKVHRASVYLQVSDKEPHKGGSASLSYSAGVIAGALFGSLAWAGTLRSLFSELFCSFVSLRPKVLP